MRLAVLCFLAALAAGTQLAQAQNWAEFRPEGAGYSVDMPGEWTVTDETVPSKVGSLKAHIATVDLGSRVYMTMYAEYPMAAIKGQPVTPLLDGARDGAVNNVHGTLRSEQRVLISNHPGREIIADTPEGAVLIDRFFLLDNKLIQAIVAGQSGVESDPATRKYLDSLQVVPNDATH